VNLKPNQRFINTHPIKQSMSLQRQWIPYHRK